MGPVFCFPGVVFPDVHHMLTYGPSALIVAEMIVFGFMAGSFVVLVLWVQPHTFFMFNVVTSVEGFTRHAAVEKAYGRGDHGHGHHH